MSLKNASIIREVSGITDDEKERIFYFLQGAIYCWCKNKKDKWFSIRDFMGGDNYFWENTPLMALYKKHEDKGKNWELAVKDAGKDSGWILKKVIEADKRTFKTKKEAFIRQYLWVGNER